MCGLAGRGRNVISLHDDDINTEERSDPLNFDAGQQELM